MIAVIVTFVAFIIVFAVSYAFISTNSAGFLYKTHVGSWKDSIYVVLFPTTSATNFLIISAVGGAVFILTIVVALLFWKWGTDNDGEGTKAFLR